MSRPWVDLLPPATEDEVGTAGAELTAAPIPVSLTRTTAKLTDRSGDLRLRSRLLGQDIDQTHQDSYMVEWRILTNRCASASPKLLLSDLADMGFAWRDLARLMGVSVPAMQKWRKGDGLTGPNRRKLASLLAACEMIKDHYHIDEVASWFEMPLLDDIPITPIDLWANDCQLLVFEHANGHVDPVDTLTVFEPEWRENYRTEVELFRDKDGLSGLQLKDV